MIRKFIIVLLAAVFASEFFQWTLYGIEPRPFIAATSFVVAFYLLFRMLMAILFVEHYLERRDAGVDSD